MKIERATDFISSHRTGRLNSRLTVKEIETKLGVSVEDCRETSGDGKVKWQWDFLVDGVECSIWDYRGARWSVYDPSNKLSAIFGADYTIERH